MPTPQELEAQFWAALKADMTLMLGLDAIEDGHARPMTALVEGERSPFWFFTAKDSDLARLLIRYPDATASATFASKGHELFASVRGSLAIDTDREVIDRLWNPFIAAWYEGGKDDPKLVLLRLDADQARIWQNATPFFAGIRLLLGADPKKDYKSKVATVPLK